MKTANCCICGTEVLVKQYTPAHRCMCDACKQKQKTKWNKNKVTQIKTDLDSLQPKQKGNYVELAVALEALKRNIRVSMPYGDNSDYDQIWDIDGRLYKVQVKYAAMLSNGSYRVNMQHGIYKDGKMGPQKYTPQTVDIFATIIDGDCCIIPIEKSSSVMTFRVTESGNQQQSGINWAHDYLMDDWLKQYNRV